jgi:hypothetical protein
MLARMTAEQPTPGPGTSAVDAATWRALAEATTRRTGSTLAALATVDATGAPQLRSVILRDCDPHAGTLGFATDGRSAKVHEIRAEPRVAVTVYDDATGVQLRLAGRATVVTDPEERRRRWAALGAHTRRGYASPTAPGTPLAADPGTGQADPDPGEPDEAWFDRFAWVEVRVDAVDRLDVSADPQERVLLTRDGDTWTGGAVAP